MKLIVVVFTLIICCLINDVFGDCWTRSSSHDIEECARQCRCRKERDCKLKLTWNGHLGRPSREPECECVECSLNGNHDDDNDRPSGGRPVRECQTKQTTATRGECENWCNKQCDSPRCTGGNYKWQGMPGSYNGRCTCEICTVTHGNRPRRPYITGLYDVPSIILQ